MNRRFLKKLSDFNSQLPTPNQRSVFFTACWWGRLSSDGQIGWMSMIVWMKRGVFVTLRHALSFIGYGFLHSAAVGRLRTDGPTRYAVVSYAVALLVLTSLLAAEGRAGEPIPKTSAQPTVASESADGQILAFKREALERATALVRSGDPAGTDRILEEVRQKLDKADPFLDELQGTIFTLKKDYAAAETAFKAMLAKAPGSPVGQFNLAETSFLQHRFSEAEQRFAALETDRRPVDPAVADLCRFKRVMCLLAAGQIPQAEVLLPEARSETGPASPAVQYSRAAIRLARKDRPGATAAFARARQDFSSDVENLYADSFLELHWAAKNDAGQIEFLPEPK